MIYDCFMFYNELDLLEIRLNELYDKVDCFVITESSHTFRGKEKGFVLEKNKDRYSKFWDKIKYVKNYTYFYDQDAWYNERYQRNILSSALISCKPEDVILLGDLDEIPNPDLITNQIKNPVQFSMTLTRYFLNLVEGHNIWNGTIIFPYSFLQDKTLQNVRDLVQTNQLPRINAGWHFSWLGDLDTIKFKMNSFSHTEIDNDEWRNRIERDFEKLKNGEMSSAFGNLFYVDVDTKFPKYIQDNTDKFKNLIYGSK